MIVTNPPYSSDHIPQLLRWLSCQGLGHFGQKRPFSGLAGSGKDGDEISGGAGAGKQEEASTDEPVADRWIKSDRVPWLLLLPNFVYMKDYFKPFLETSALEASRGIHTHFGGGTRSGRPSRRGGAGGGGRSRRAASNGGVMFLTPAQRYVYANLGRATLRTCEGYSTKRTL